MQDHSTLYFLQPGTSTGTFPPLNGYSAMICSLGEGAAFASGGRRGGGRVGRLGSGAMAGGAEKNDGADWVERIVRFGAALGFNEVRLRWKCLRLQRSVEQFRRRSGTTVRRLRYEHKVCPHCGALQDREATACSSCSGKLRSRPMEIVARIGLISPAALSPTTVLAAAIVLAYIRVGLAEGGAGLLGLDARTLFRFGGRWSPAVWRGDWWRLGTSIFLHANLWHLGFNMIALTQVGPRVEEVFGRARMLVLFMSTGIVASLASSFFSPGGVGIGASGAIMGLIGAAAGWGHREGTPFGRAVRAAMVQWLVYTLIFGFLVGADNVAHAAGFLAGGAFGYALPPAWQRREVVGPALFAALLLALGAAGLSVLLVLFPGASRWL